MLNLSDDLLLEIFRFVTCSRTLRRASRVCKPWNALCDRAADIFQHAWLTVNARTVVDALMADISSDQELLSMAKSSSLDLCM